MDNELYLKWFFIEKYNDVNMYYEYLKGQVFLEQNLFNNWFKEMEIRNNTFAKSLRDFDRFNIRNTVIESALSDTLCVSNHIFNKSEKHISEFGKFKIERKSLGNSTNHYICNGYYIDTLEQIYNVLNKGAFTVGICMEKKTKLYSDVVKHYGDLRNFLLKNGYQTSSLEANCGKKNRVYLLMYDACIKRR